MFGKAQGTAEIAGFCRRTKRKASITLGKSRNELEQEVEVDEAMEDNKLNLGKVPSILRSGAIRT